MARTEAERLAKMLQLRHWSALRAALAPMPDADIAELLLDQPREHWVFLLKMLPKERASRVVGHLEAPYQAWLVENLASWESRELILGLPADERTAVLAELSSREAERLIQAFPPADARAARELLGYPTGSAGRLLNPGIIELRPDYTVHEALEAIRDQSGDEVLTNVVFVIEADGTLLGQVQLRSLVLAEPGVQVRELLRGDPISVPASARQERAVALARHYDLEAVAVTDRHGRLIGAVTVDDLLDVVERDSTRSFQLLGGVGVIGLRLRDAGVALLYRKRIGWLMALIGVSVFSSGLIEQQAETLQAAFVLVTFLPLIIDCGGNAGAQSAILTVRALATGDVVLRDWWRLAVREVGLALALAVTVGAAVLLLGVARASPCIAMLVAGAAAAVVILGSMVGLILPFLLSACRMDPAIASTPLVTSVADLVGISVFVWMVTLFF